MIKEIVFQSINYIQLRKVINSLVEFILTMFGNSKEYQDIKKLYEERVSKPEKLDEFVGLGVKKAVETGAKKVKENPNMNMGSGAGKALRGALGGSGASFGNAIKMGQKLNISAKPNTGTDTEGIRKPIPQRNTGTDTNKMTEKDLSDIKKEDGLQKALANKKNLQKIETKTGADKKEVDFKLRNTESSEQSAKAETAPEKRKLTGAERAKLIAKARIKSGKTISQVNAANKQSMRDRARARNEKFKAERKKKQESKKLGRPQPKVKSPMDMRNESYDAYDIVLEYLLSTEQAATIEEANYVMTEMDAETIQGIIEEQKKNIDEGVPLIPILAKGAAIAGGALLARKGIKDTKKKFDNYLNKQRNQSTFGGNKRVEDTRKNSGDNKVGEKIYYGK